MVRSTSGLHRYAAVRWRAEELAAALSASGLVSRAAVAGGVRRRREVVTGIDLVAATARREDLARAFPELAGIAETLSVSEQGVTVRLADGPAASPTIAAEDEFAAALLDATGSDEHVAALRARASERGLVLDQRGL